MSVKRKCDEKFALHLRRNYAMIFFYHSKEGMGKPYCYRNKAYKRNDSATVPVDRIELNNISKEEYLRGKVSVLRNPILAGVFARLGIIEKIGVGRGTKYLLRKNIIE